MEQGTTDAEAPEGSSSLGRARRKHGVSSQRARAEDPGADAPVRRYPEESERPTPESLAWAGVTIVHESVPAFINARASGARVLVGESEPETIFHQAASVASTGAAYWSPSLVRLAEASGVESPPTTWVLPEHALSHRELEVTLMRASGHDRAEIARRLCVGENTVKTHLSRAYRKLGITCRAELAAWLPRLRSLKLEGD